MNPNEPTRTRMHGTRVTRAKTPDERIAAIQAIVDACQYARVDGTMIDLFTANAIVTVDKALNETNRAKFRSLPAGRMGLVAFKLLK